MNENKQENKVKIVNFVSKGSQNTIPDAVGNAKHQANTWLKENKDRITDAQHELEITRIPNGPSNYFKATITILVKWK